MSVLKLSSTLQVLDFYSPPGYQGESDGDQDLGNVGPLVIPGTSLLFIGGTKYGYAHLLDSQNLGQWNSSKTDTALQSIQVGSNEVGQNAVAWAGTAGTFMYIWGGDTSLQQFHLVGRSIVPSTGSYKTYSGSNEGAALCISSNGDLDSILWASGFSGGIYAFNATDVSSGPIWSSNMNSSRDGISGTAHFSFPVVTNGHVYIPASGSVAVYGLLGNAYPPAIPNPPVIVSPEIQPPSSSPPPTPPPPSTSPSTPTPPPPPTPLSATPTLLSIGSYKLISGFAAFIIGIMINF